MAKKKIIVSGKNLGITLVIALIIEHILPKAGISFLSPLPVLIYLAVAIYLIFF
jgi:hypothetical protein